MNLFIRTTHRNMHAIAGPPVRPPARAKNTPRACFARAFMYAQAHARIVHALSGFYGRHTLPPDRSIFLKTSSSSSRAAFQPTREVCFSQTLLRLIFCQKLISLLKNLIPSMGHIFPHLKVFLRSLNFPL